MLVLGSSQCKVLSVLDLEDTFHALRLSENSKRYCRILPYFGSVSYLYQRIPKGLYIPTSIWQSYINTITECLQSRKCCEVIMDDLLFFTSSKKSHIAKLRRLIENFAKMDLRFDQRNVNYLEQNYNIWVIRCL